MNKYAAIIIILILTLSACNNGVIDDDHEIEVVIIQINDVYEIASLGGGTIGGMARVAHLRKEMLKENPNTLLMHAGDFLSPSLVGTLKMDGERVKGKQMIEMMNIMNFDLVALGNHEFDLKYEDLQKRFDESNFPWISTNVNLLQGDSLVPFFANSNGEKKEFPRYVIKTLKDDDGTSVDIGFISATLDSNPREYVDCRDFYEAAKLAYRQVSAKSDFVLGLTHLSLTQDKLLSQTIPEIPLIMGGHEHQNKNLAVGDARITKADANAKSVYIHRITYNTKTKERTITSELKIIDETVNEDAEAAKLVSKWNDFQLSKLEEVVDNPDEIVYRTLDTLDGRDNIVRGEQTLLGQIIAEAMYSAFAGDVDAAILNGGSIRIDDQLVGDITGVDIFRILPFGGGVLKIKIKGDMLLKVLQFGHLSAGEGAYLQRYKVDRKDGAWFVDGKEVNPNKLYKIAISDYLIRGIDIPMLKEENVADVYRPTEDELGYDIRKAVINLLKSKNK